MSHSFDSTLLQRMGFKDPDRKTPEHDRACIELASSPSKLVARLGIEHSKAKALLEVPLQKGDGKYASTVGFIDAVMMCFRRFPSVECESRTHTYERPRVRCPECKDVEHHHAVTAVLVEVKTAIENVGDLLRQMNLYREYKKDHERVRVERYVIWSLREADRALTELLADQGYTLIAGGM